MLRKKEEGGRRRRRRRSKKKQGEKEVSNSIYTNSRSTAPAAVMLYLDNSEVPLFKKYHIFRRGRKTDVPPYAGEQPAFGGTSVFLPNDYCHGSLFLKGV